jgi:hypothetical protein
LYYQEEFIGMDAMADDAIYRDLSHRMHLLSTGRAQMTSYAGSSWWSRDYEAINYLNKFLKDDMGYKSRYLVDNNADAFLVEALQGDAYGLRAYYYYDLLKKFGGRGTDGKMLGVPIFLELQTLSTRRMTMWSGLLTTRPWRGLSRTAIQHLSISP